MLNTYAGIIIGGLIPALLFGISGLFLKASTRSGISFNYYLLCAGLGAVVIGLASFFVCKEHTVNYKSAFFASLVGLFWGGGAVLMAIAVIKLAMPVSIIVPIVATNSLVTILLSFLVYSEWRNVQIVKLIIGAALIVIGGILVSQANK
jgi:transporter family protein